MSEETNSSTGESLGAASLAGQPPVVAWATAECPACGGSFRYNPSSGLKTVVFDGKERLFCRRHAEQYILHRRNIEVSDYHIPQGAYPPEDHPIPD